MQIELCWYKAWRSPTQVVPDAIGLERGKKCTVVEPVHSAAPAATASHGAATASPGAATASHGAATSSHGAATAGHGAATASPGVCADAIPAGWKERMQRFQEERCSTHAFLQMNGKQVQLQKAGWSKEFSLAHLF
ncbi:hypothetical protein EK904_005327 [Melospiza melodia maxima]|nr:hypothetical protein EK904_005327 [Melospiza melodia maxima]